MKEQTGACGLHAGGAGWGRGNCKQILAINKSKITKLFEKKLYYLNNRFLKATCIGCILLILSSDLKYLRYFQNNIRWFSISYDVIF